MRPAVPASNPIPVLDLDGAIIERSWTRPVTWTGWHAASALPKPEELCAVAGSTYRLTGPPGMLPRPGGTAAPATARDCAAPKASARSG